MPVVGFAYLFMSVWRAGTERPVMPETSLLDDETRREGGRRGMSPTGRVGAERETWGRSFGRNVAGGMLRLFFLWKNQLLLNL